MHVLSQSATRFARTLLNFQGMGSVLQNGICAKFSDSEAEVVRRRRWRNQNERCTKQPQLAHPIFHRFFPRIFGVCLQVGVPNFFHQIFPEFSAVCFPTENWKRKRPHPHTSILLRNGLKRLVLLRADLVLTKDPKWSSKEQFCGKIDRGLVVKRPGVLKGLVRTKSALSKTGRFF